jgi:hypothetical protein
MKHFHLKAIGVAIALILFSLALAYYGLYC